MQKNLIKLILTLVAVSCVFLFYNKIKLDATESETSEPAVTYADSLPDDFHTFYDRFHTDSIYQMNHIIFPLSGVVQQGDSVLTLITKQWLADEWKLHKPFDNHGGTFERTFTNSNSIISETITGNGGMFTVEKRYSKLAGEWHLIYYQGLVMHG
jgi:hypothetical protein